MAWGNGKCQYDDTYFRKSTIGIKTKTENNWVIKQYKCEAITNKHYYWIPSGNVSNGLVRQNLSKTDAVIEKYTSMD